MEQTDKIPRPTEDMSDEKPEWTHSQEAYWCEDGRHWRRVANGKITMEDYDEIMQSWMREYLSRPGGGLQ